MGLQSQHKLSQVFGMCENKKIEKFPKLQQGEKIKNYSQILKSWTPPHYMHTFFLSNYRFKFLTKSATELQESTKSVVQSNTSLGNLKAVNTQGNLHGSTKSVVQSHTSLGSLTAVNTGTVMSHGPNVSVKVQVTYMGLRSPWSSHTVNTQGYLHGSTKSVVQSHTSLGRLTAVNTGTDTTHGPDASKQICRSKFISYLRSSVRSCMSYLMIQGYVVMHQNIHMKHEISA